ncbi:hypothetical protein BJ138DRAFT_998379 [Hygrophoropsis aurantiaca]|uniref:Uncharacterized protein n=1 Tax=Hygrophoropsis aurantiaca TaxID=72124 RepID=A0ACB8AQD7_9AGAM|nr:hypothetical protein BJ138DRAFT_998379 [Hygrophoropsis aurantiaca]
MSLLKIPFILSAAIGFHVSLTAPSTPETNEILTSVSLLEKSIIPITALCTTFMKGMVSVAAAGEIAVILQQFLQLPHFPAALGRPDASRTTSAFLFGSLLFTLSGLIRWQCYRELGRFFTFNLSLRKNHRLITTGPYSVVRHPSYTGLPLCALGAYGMSSWVRESGMLNIWAVRMLVGTWCALITIITITLMGRTRKEDVMLKEEFGEEWEEWAKRVRYRLVPGIY